VYESLVDQVRSIFSLPPLKRCVTGLGRVWTGPFFSRPHIVETLFQKPAIPDAGVLLFFFSFLGGATKKTGGKEGGQVEGRCFALFLLPFFPAIKEGTLWPSPLFLSFPTLHIMFPPRKVAAVPPPFSPSLPQFRAELQGSYTRPPFFFFLSFSIRRQHN